MFLWRKSWIFCCYDLWEVNVSLQIIVDFLILWLFCKSNVFLKEIEDFPLLLLVRSQCISADNCGFSAFMTLWKVKCFSGDFLMLWLVRRQYLSADNCGFSAFVTLLEVKSFSAGNCGFSAVKTCEKSISLNRKLCIFLLLWLIGKSNVSLQIIMDFLILWLFGKSNVSLKEIVDFNCTLRGLSTQADHHLLFVGSLFTLLRQLIDCPSSLPVEGELVYGKDRLLQSFTSFMWGRVCQGLGKVMVRQGVYLMDFLLFWLMTYEKSNVSLLLSVDFLISSTSGCCFLKFSLVLHELVLCESIV